MSLAKGLSRRFLEHLRWKRRWGASPAPSQRNVRRLSSLLLILGIVLLVFAAGAYGWMSLEQHRLKTQGRVQNASLTAEWGTNYGLTLLSIPKIHLQAAVLNGTGRKTLLLAPAHLQATVWPGQAGNSVIAGHRDTFFRHIPELEKGDDVYVRRGGHEFHYLVTAKSIVAPDDMAVVQPTPDSRLTLITCYPTYYIGPAPQRLVVVASLESAGRPNPKTSHLEPFGTRP